MDFLKWLTQSLFGSFLSSGAGAGKSRSKQRTQRRLKPKARAKAVKKKAAPKKRRRPSAAKLKKAPKPKLKPKPKPVKAAALKRAKKKALPVGTVTHYFPKVHAVAVRVLRQAIRQGDTLLVSGKSGEFKIKVSSLQINRIPVEEGRVGEEVGILVKKTLHEGDELYKV